MRITRVIAATALVVSAVVAGAMPASAHAASTAFTYTLSTSGTWATVSPACGSTPCPAGSTWSFISSGSVSSNRVSGVGTFNGWCHRSTGVGSMTLDGDSGSVTWESAGTIVVLTGSAHGHTVFGAVLAMRTAAGTGDCVTASTTSFDGVGTAYVF